MCYTYSDKYTSTCINKKYNLLKLNNLSNKKGSTWLINIKPCVLTNAWGLGGLVKFAHKT